MRTAKQIAVCVLMIFANTVVKSQSLPVGTAALEDYYRRAQLLGITDTNVSLTVRPVFPRSGVKKDQDTILSKYNSTSLFSRQIFHQHLQLSLLPVSIQSEFNSDHPSGWNDGPMIPARGLQTLVSPGFFMQYGPLSVQLKPEFLYAQNTSFVTFNPIQYDVIFARYYDIYNNIDLPVRFGTTSYKKAYWGQSSIRLSYKALSVGVSTENLWWGPGIRNSLLMSNTAPGFAHLTLNTTRPINTPIGSFEGQIIAGRLENSGFAPLEPDHYFFSTDLYVPKPNDWRYLKGFVLTWQPKWLPGLFLGYDASSQTYEKNLSGFGDYLPFFSPVKKTSAPDSPISTQDQLSSVFMRWLWAQEHAEIYFEFGQYGNSQDLYQLLLAPNNSRAYIFGVRKLLPFNKSKNENILIGIEVTQLQENSISNIKSGKEWYVSQSTRQGYTNMGQELGAGIGPGGNLQSVDVSWVKGLKKIGLQFERYVHNNDFYYYAFEDVYDYTRHWVDLSVAATCEWSYKNFIFNAKYQVIKSLDYQWALKQNGNDPYFVNQSSTTNIQIQAGISYKF
ncbi:MAG: capsule assembly Wzi family protein [Mucilaginibacter sp.]